MRVLEEGKESVCRVHVSRTPSIRVNIMYSLQVTTKATSVSFSNGDLPALFASNISLVDYDSPDAVLYSLQLAVRGVRDNETLIADPVTCNITGCVVSNVITQLATISEVITASNLSSYQSVSIKCCVAHIYVTVMSMYLLCNDTVLPTSMLQ